MEEQFAALKLPGLDNEHKLPRATSFSELPSTRKIVIEQCYQSPHKPSIVRQCSCEQIFDKSANTSEVKYSEVLKVNKDELWKTWKTTIPYVNCFKRPDWSSFNGSKVLSIEKPTENVVEHMEIDSDLLHVEPFEPALKNITQTELERVAPSKQYEESTDSNKSGLNTYCNYEQVKGKIVNDKGFLNFTPKVTYESAKLKFRSLVPPQSAKEPIRRMNSCSRWKLLFFVLLPILALIIAAIVSQEKLGPMVICSHSSDYFNATIELQDKIFGQKQAIVALSESLTRDTPCIKIVAILGGSGTGKSYSVDIIRRHFSRTHSIYQYYSPLTATLSKKEFWPFTCNLVILENLNKNDLPHVVSCGKTFQSRENYCITVLAVFNTEEVDLALQRKVDLEHDRLLIKNSFEKEGITADVIPFEHLSESTLTKCILYTAKENGVVLSESQIDNIKSGLLLSDTGCKGAYSKVQLLKMEQSNEDISNETK